MEYEDDEDDVCSILAPITVGAAQIVSTNIAAEDPNPLWAVGNTYAKGFRVYKAGSHKVYESAVANNTGKDPDLGPNRFDAAGVVTFWIYVGPTNLYAAFDGSISTKTIYPEEITYTLKLGYFNGFAVFGADADEIDFEIVDAPGGNVIYSYEGPLEGSQPADYYEHFFGPFAPQTQFIATDIDPYYDMQIRLTLRTPGGTVGVGMIAIGDMQPLGLPLAGASVEPTDGSYITSDAFNETVIRKRPSTTGLRITAKTTIAEANSVVETIRRVLGTPIVVVGSQVTMYEALTVFGLPSAQIVYDEFGNPSVILTVKGLI